MPLKDDPPIFKGAVAEHIRSGFSGMKPIVILISIEVSAPILSTMSRTRMGPVKRLSASVFIREGYALPMSLPFYMDGVYRASVQSACGMSQ